MTKAIICDLEGVILQGNTLIPGAAEFVQKMLTAKTPFLILSNFSYKTTNELKNRLKTLGLDVPKRCFYTSAMATADFLGKQKGRKAYVVGEGALLQELYRVGFTLTDDAPDYVVIGETEGFDSLMIKKAATCILNGARFIATNPEAVDAEDNPSCGAFCAPIERITDSKPFVVGKPSSLILQTAYEHLAENDKNVLVIGDDIESDVLAGVRAGFETALVLTGVTQSTALKRYPYRPHHVLAGLKELESVLAEPAAQPVS